jgi:hypothetical protein
MGLVPLPASLIFCRASVFYLFPSLPVCMMRRKRVKWSRESCDL